MSRSDELRNKANWVRSRVLDIIGETGKGHVGGTFSCVDIFVALYYGGILRFDAKNPAWDGRDRFVVGKGHACLALYNIWADLGFMDAGRIREYGRDGGSLSGQLNIDTPGVEYNTGSLGNALGVAAGMALAAKMDKRNNRVFALIGDGECDEGAVWESLMFASKYRLTNLIGIVDRNRLSATDRIEEEAGVLENKIISCGWECKVIDGHSFEKLLDVFSRLDELDKPLMVIAETIKGKGVSFMENEVKWHHSTPHPEELKRARLELNKDALDRQEHRH